MSSTVVVDLARDLAGMIAELHSWREVGKALEALEPAYPGLAAAIQAELSRCATPINRPARKRRR